MIQARSTFLASPEERLQVTTGNAACVILCVAVLARWATFGNPLIQIDEEFYLLVGDRMLHGRAPLCRHLGSQADRAVLVVRGYPRCSAATASWQYQIDRD